MLDLGGAVRGMPDSEDFDIQMGIGKQQSMGRSGKKSTPRGFPSSGSKNHGSRGFGGAFTRDYKQQRGRVFQNTLKTESGGKRDSADRLRGEVAQIDGDSAESASL